MAKGEVKGVEQSLTIEEFLEYREGSPRVLRRSTRHPGKELANQEISKTDSESAAASKVLGTIRFFCDARKLLNMG